MKKILLFLMFVLIINLLAGAGVAAYLVATGRLDKEKSLAIVDLLKHQGTPDKFRDTLDEVLYPTSAPATSTAPATTQTAQTLPSDATLASLATAQDRIEFARKAVEQERLRLENETRNLLARQKMLEEQRAAVAKQFDQLTSDKKTFEDQVKTTDSRLKDENFQRTVAIYNDLKAKQVKDLLMPLDVNLVADYFRAFDEDHTTKLIAEFKTPAEREYIASVLDKIRTSGTTSADQPSQQASTQTAANVPARP